MAPILPIIQGATALVGLGQMLTPPKAPQAPPVLSWDQAMTQAQAQLNPLYQEQLQKTMQTVDHNNVARGFYGQMPGDAFKNARALDVERARLAAISGLANQMQGQSQDRASQYALSAAQNAANWKNNLGQNLMGWSNSMSSFLMPMLNNAKTVGQQSFAPVQQGYENLNPWAVGSAAYTPNTGWSSQNKWY